MDITLPAPFHISIHINVSPTLFVVIGAIIVILVLLLLIRGWRRRRVVRHRGGGPRPHARSTRRRTDHGARIARKHGHERSPQWGRVEKQHLLREPVCAACGYQGKGLQVHHIKPFHLHPALELDPNNLITLCEIPAREHHLLLGHLDNWESYNEHVRRHALRFANQTAEQIRADLGWLKEVRLRP